LGVKMPAGSASPFGTNQTDSAKLTDVNGNPLSHMQPGMIVNLGADGALESFDPSRPGGNSIEWIQHMARTIATAFPGVKASTLTGDYRRSSFSSERSADNDAWPELEDVQEWFASDFCQPIYAQTIIRAAEVGYFDGVAGVAQLPPGATLAAWRGPVARSINPKDDALAAHMRISTLQSSPQIEAAAAGYDWRELLEHLREFIDACREAEIPEWLTQQLVGLDEKVLAQLASQTISEEDLDDVESPNAQAA